ncbi:MAG TPA: serine/threonine-protein kinase [Anaeromyxobacteraceae bacterium]|jgi:serine/threonine-protein kinase
MVTCPTCRQAHDDDVAVCPADGTALAPPDPMLGRVLGERYRLLLRIGEGGMGTVYRAEHVVLGRRMAVKVLRPEYSNDEDLVRRFQREAVAASRIGQENIVDVVDFGRTREGNLYFVMEELPGVSLASVLAAEGSLALDRVARLLAQVCRALAAAHAHGIVHRDLKPDNVIVVQREDGSELVKVVDFGISKSGAESGDRLTRAGTIIGTPEYMAPEQGAAATVDHRADIYAFGIMAYEMSTGTIPFQGPTAIATLLEHQTRAPEPPGRRRPGMPGELERMILRALAKKPEERQQSMAEVAEELTRVLALYRLPPVYERGRTPPPAVVGGLTARFATPLRGVRGATVDIGTGERLPPPSRIGLPPEGFWRRRRAEAVAVLLVALAAGSAIAVTAWRAGPPAEQWVPAAPEPQAAALAPEAAPVPPPAPEPVPRLHVTLRSEPAGAEVFAGAERLGTTPLTVVLAPGDAAEYRFALAGHRPASRRVVAEAGEVEVALERIRRAAAPSGKRKAPAPSMEVGAPADAEQNPYRKLDDLKPNPF